VTLPSTEDLSCERLPAAQLPFEFVNLPERLPRPANDNHPLSGFVGAWRGSLDNGDDVMLIVEDGPLGRVPALFARGRSRDAAGDKAFVQRQHGRFDAEGRILVFDEPERLRITAVRQCRPAPGLGDQYRWPPPVHRRTRAARDWRAVRPDGALVPLIHRRPSGAAVALTPDDLLRDRSCSVGPSGRPRGRRSTRHGG
jgi:hypothetical protein